ncbi:MAG TPA: helix-turn-helix transcriptional regulator [Usitatibacter sp.]|nr:helix-turn-helix transcriptional regulator [Usitatibacter sp.]
MKATVLDSKSEQMLELLSQGASARVVAQKMGYSEGTMRVYLHHLYKVIGVRNKTEAVIWHLNRARAKENGSASPPAAALPSQASFGEMALAEDLYAALGVMSSFLGPYGHVWEAGVRMKGVHIDQKVLARRAQSRLLWRALLKGDFGYAKTLYDESISERLLCDAPSDAALLVSLLLIGGYSSAAEDLVARLRNKRKGGSGISAREAALLRSLQDALYAKEAAPMTALYNLAVENTTAPILKQVAMVALFHVYKARKDADRARRTANAIWAEAEAARQQLEAMGVRPLGRAMSLPRPTEPSAREAGSVREKTAATR